MANTKGIEAFSTDSASANASTDSPNSDYADGLNAGLFKNKFRGLKMSIAASWYDTHVGLTTGGTTTAYTGTSKRSIDTYFEGLTQVITPNANCGANPTFSLNSVGAKPIKTASGGAIAEDDLVADIAYKIRYTTQSSGQWRLTAPLPYDLAGEIGDASGKTTPVGADLLAMLDSAASFVVKTLSITNLVSYLNSTDVLTAFQAAGSYFPATGGSADNITEGSTNLFLASGERTKVGYLTVTGAANIDGMKPVGVASDFLTGASDKALTGDAIWDAAAIVSVTMDSAMEIDLAEGILFKASAELNTNSTLSFGNTTGKAGRTIQFKFTCDSSARTLTFPSGSVTDGGFATLTKEFAASETHKAYCTIDEDGVYDWSFRSGIKAAAD